MNRSDEIRRLLKLTPAEMKRRAGRRLLILKDVDAMHRHCADSIADEIIANNKKRAATVLILPVGPVGQYPYLLQRINSEGIRLCRCHFFFMDEYCDDNGCVVPKSHPLSFRGHMDEMLFSQIRKDLMIPPEQLVFPDHLNVQTLAKRIDDLGGIQTCYGGIGIHGHLAFNEPEPNVERSEPRLVYLNDFTVTINAIRAQVGGDLINFPRKAVTLGMRQILTAKKIQLYCRNGIALDWANAVLRLALFGAPGDDYPVTFIRGKNYLIVTDRDTARRPAQVL
ncbi:MAG: glucosamine-6-phosphate isomerase [Planctomycetes bacterium]|nr:glucosamine-6-phosphate isomerase [Planctomycetota bacterium]